MIMVVVDTFGGQWVSLVWWGLSAFAGVVILFAVVGFTIGVRNVMVGVRKVDSLGEESLSEYLGLNKFPPVKVIVGSLLVVGVALVGLFIPGGVGDQANKHTVGEVSRSFSVAADKVLADAGYITEGELADQLYSIYSEDEVYVPEVSSKSEQVFVVKEFVEGSENEYFLSVDVR